jgi:hypothetical protein
VNALVGMDLVARDKEGVRARKETILAFLPARIRGDEGDPADFDDADFEQEETDVGDSEDEQAQAVLK